MAYQMTATAVTLDDLEGHSPVASLFKCNKSNICAAFYTIFTAPAYAVLGVLVLSVRLSHACIVTKLNDALQIF